MKVEDILKYVTDETKICIHPEGTPLEECEIWQASAWGTYRYSKYTVYRIIPRTSVEDGDYLLIKCYNRKGII